MPSTLYIHEDLKRFVESYILNNNPDQEHGGYFLGANYQLIIPIFLPNVSNTPQRSYQMPSNYQIFLETFKQMFQLESEWHFHTHPSHSVVSEQDVRSASYYTDIQLLIMYDKAQQSFSWDSYDRNGIKHYLQFVSQQYELFKTFFAHSLGLLNLGSSFVTPSGELICNDSFGKAFLSFDYETFQVYKYLLAHKNRFGGISVPKLAKMQEELQLSSNRIKRAKELIKQFKLIDL